MKSFIAYLKQIFRKDKQEIETINFDIKELSLYYNLLNDEVFKSKTNQSILDLDLNDVFFQIDYANSIIGKQYLYNHLVSQQVKAEEIDVIEKNMEYLEGNPFEKLSLQKILKKASSTKLFQLPYLFLTSSIPIYKNINIYFLLSFSALLSLVLSFFNSSFLLLFLFIAILNLAIHYNNKRKLIIYSESLSQLQTLYKTALEIKKLSPFISNQNLKEESIDSLSSIRHWLKLISSGNYMELNDLMLILWYPFELLKGCFLIELIAMHKVFQNIDLQKDNIHSLYKLIGKTDLYLSILELRKQMPYYCKPNFVNNSKTLICEDIIHPLIENCIPNSISLSNQSLIITGSNMSGKTTFLRTIATNNILANTINTCFAKRFVTSKMQTLTSIRVTDDILESKSFFFEEVSLIKTLIDYSSKEDNCLFIIDELFKGTNTRERIATSKSILHFLNKSNHIILFSTHDLELIELLDKGFERGYFYEKVEQGEIKFDYKFKIGKSYLTNAIRILELNNYPQEIIEDAYNNIKDS